MVLITGILESMKTTPQKTNPAIFTHTHSVISATLETSHPERSNFS